MALVKMNGADRNGRAGVSPGGPPWVVHLRAVDHALARKNVRAAKQAWEDAHLAAVGSWRWDGLIEVGDACLRIGDLEDARPAAEPTARKAYFAALFRACQKESFVGILRTAEAFLELGDEPVVEECLSLAEVLAGDDAEARARVRAFTARTAGHTRPAEPLPETVDATPPGTSTRDARGPSPSR